MGCKNSKSPTPVPKPEIPKPKKSHTTTPKPEISKPKKSHTSTLKPEIPKSKKLPASAKRKNISEENIKTYQSAYTPNYYMDYSCTTPIPIPET